MIKISIIIPVYNVEKYLPQCLTSVTHQTLRDIEIICINDASTDHSSDILKAFAKNDTRIKIQHLSRNRGTNFARKTGVLIAQGKYLMFLDSDDMLVPNACEILFQYMEKYQTDIIQFGTNLIAEPELDAERILHSISHLVPYPKKLEGSDVLNACFKNHNKRLYRHTLWNKIYRTPLCQTAFYQTEDTYLINGEDYMSYFIIAYNARSYIGIPDKFYFYHLGRGISGRTELSLKHLDKYCQCMVAVDALVRFINAQNLTEYQGEFITNLRLKMLMNTLTKYYIFLPLEIQKEGYPILRRYWNEEEIRVGFLFLSNNNLSYMQKM